MSLRDALSALIATHFICAVFIPTGAGFPLAMPDWSSTSEIERDYGEVLSDCVCRSRAWVLTHAYLCRCFHKDDVRALRGVRLGSVRDHALRLGRRSGAAPVEVASGAFQFSPTLFEANVAKCMCNLCISAHCPTPSRLLLLEPLLHALGHRRPVSKRQPSFEIEVDTTDAAW